MRHLKLYESFSDLEAEVDAILNSTAMTDDEKWEKLKSGLTPHIRPNGVNPTANEIQEFVRQRSKILKKIGLWRLPHDVAEMRSRIEKGIDPEYFNIELCKLMSRLEPQEASRQYPDIFKKIIDSHKILAKMPYEWAIKAGEMSGMSKKDIESIMAVYDMGLDI